ncbi:cobalamin-dependent protein [Streptomyces spinoverrucosus]|uniref:cobalamin B12-binding domain-containing protein n=1 Tax=Streptomyces spinoverrucosus TaxID=284043 RepID=UPI0018C435CA|nr:cobalamin-dependent protein [Streptomyces spinoverrucosus]MBG0854634.1 cobalamin-dependent protein [Streptomyces spinoverrucosus]
MDEISPARSGRFIVTSVSSDAHMWNLVFLQLLLEERGGEVVNLGACVPDDVILAECRRVRPDALVVSTVNGHGHLDGLRLIQRIRSDSELADLRVVIGGKLGIRGSENARFGTELVAAGFDAAFEAEAGLAEFDAFLGGLEKAPARELATAGRGA